MLWPSVHHVVPQMYFIRFIPSSCVCDHSALWIPMSLFQLYQQGRLCQLGGEFCELEVFAKVLRASDKR